VILRAALLALACALPAAADPADGLDGAEVAELVRAAMTAAGAPGSGVAVSASRPFPACGTVPTVAPRVAGDWRTVTLTCAAPAWQRSVRTGAAAPAGLPARAQATDDGPRVLVLAESLSAGTVIAARHLTSRPIARAQAGALTDPAQAVGRRLRAHLPEGRALLARHLDHDWAVAAGAPVAISAGLRGIDVSTPGTALEPGRIGDLIEVRNARSGRTIRAIVAGANLVTVAPNMN
jgi:flagellar basal body P-ring formation protein FlgA